MLIQFGPMSRETASVPYDGFHSGFLLYAFKVKVKSCLHSQWIYQKPTVFIDSRELTVLNACPLGYFADVGPQAVCLLCKRSVDAE